AAAAPGGGCAVASPSAPLAPLDQLADPLPALVADLGVEARALLAGDGLAALAADLLIEGVAALARHGPAALAADLLVEVVTVALGDDPAALLAAQPARLLDGH